MADIETIAGSVASLKEGFEEHRYICSDEIATAVFLAYQLRKPVLIEGPPGVGKTAAWRLIARQILGPSWRSTTHVLQARDLARSAGAMKTFEDFLRPGGSSSKDTLAGRSSLDSFDSNITNAVAGDAPPAGI